MPVEHPVIKTDFFILGLTKGGSEPYDSTTSVLKQVLECWLDARITELEAKLGELFRFGSNAIKQQTRRFAHCYVHDPFRGKQDMWSFESFRQCAAEDSVADRVRGTQVELAMSMRCFE